MLASTAAASLQSCPTLCNPIDGSPSGSPVPGILQARTLEWVAISFSNERKWKVKVKSLSRVRLFETPWPAAHQAPPSMGFSRQEYWSGVPSLPYIYIWQNESGISIHLSPPFWIFLPFRTPECKFPVLYSVPISCLLYQSFNSVSCVQLFVTPWTAAS